MAFPKLGFLDEKDAAASSLYHSLQTNTRETNGYFAYTSYLVYHMLTLST